jgi:gas vesicle protein
MAKSIHSNMKGEFEVKSKEFWKGMLFGAAAGATAALLTAPKKGVEVREDIGNGAKEVGRKAGATLVDAKDRATTIAGSAKERAVQAATKTKEVTGSATSRLHNAVKAGIEAAASKHKEMTADLKEDTPEAKCPR